MTLEQKRMNTIVGWSLFFMVPISALGLFAFSAERLILPYSLFASTSHIIAIIILILRRNFLFWYFIFVILTGFTSMVIGFALNTGAMLVIAFDNYIPSDLILIGTLIFFITYCYFPLRYYHTDFVKTKDKRLESFDFEKGTYDITKPSLLRGDAFADYYNKSFLAKAHYGIIKFHLIFPISGGAIAIVAGNISKNLQLGIGIFAALLSTILFIQGLVPSFLSAWQVLQLEKKHGKKIRILWGDESEKSKD